MLLRRRGRNIEFTNIKIGENALGQTHLKNDLIVKKCTYRVSHHKKSIKRLQWV
jgi:hypothetical protein